MPDIQTALATALKEWEPPMGEPVTEAAAPAPKSSRNMTRDTFAMIRDNPGISRADAVKRLNAMGHKPQSTTSIISQMLKVKMISKTGGALSTHRKHYTVLQTEVRKTPKPQAAPKHIEAAPQPQATPALQRVSTESDIDAWMNTIPLNTARAIYTRLHAIFGGKPL